MPKPFVPIIMGSMSDAEHAEKISVPLKKWGIDGQYRVCSAHKNSPGIIRMISSYDTNKDLTVVYITIAGRSDGLSGTVAGHTTRPVIGCPPYSDKYGGSGPSTYYMPSRTPVLYVPDPENAALAAVRIFALNDEELSKELNKYMIDTHNNLETDDLSAIGVTFGVEHTLNRPK